MGFKVVFTSPAIDDLRGITEYVSRDNPDSAEKLGLQIIAKTEMLSEFPLIGRSVPEFKVTTIREIIHGALRVVYRVREEANTIEVLRVWHAARGVPQL